MPVRSEDFARTLYDARRSVPNRNLHNYEAVLEWLILAAAYRRRRFRGRKATFYLNLAIDRLNFMHGTNMPGVPPRVWFWQKGNWRQPVIGWAVAIVVMVIWTTAIVAGYCLLGHPSPAPIVAAAPAGQSTWGWSDCAEGQNVSDLGSLLVGDTGYTTIWAIYTYHGHLLVDSGYPASSCPAAGENVRVKRMDGYFMIWSDPPVQIQVRTSGQAPGFEPGIPAIER